MSFDTKYATLCLLITYHWHASWAVSTWPSGGAGIAAEVNGSPTDARLNIPVVKRSSNQAKLANEPPPRPGVIHGDSRERLVRDGAFGLSESTDRGNSSPKYMEGMIRLEESRRGMIGGSLDDGSDGSMFQDGTRKKWIRDDDEGIEEMSMGQLIARNIIPPRFLRQEDRSFDHQRAFASISRGKREAAEEENNGTTINRPEIDGVFDVQRSSGDKSAAVLLGDKREALLVDVGRLGGAGLPRRKESIESQDQNSASLFKGSPLLQASNLREDGGKGPSGNSGITLEVAKLLDSSRLHQQSRNTKPRTIVQHLRGERQTNDHRPRLSRTHELRDSDIRVRLYGRPVITDRRHRRQPNAQPVPSFTKFNGNPNQLRFIPFYNHYATNNPKRSNHIDEPLTDSEQLGRQNIANLSTLEDEAEIKNLRDSLSGVFDRHLGPERIPELPNVRAILPKQVFVASPKLIYDTKILPAPFPLDKYFQSLGMPEKDRINNREKNNQPESPVNGVYDPEDIKAHFVERPASATGDHPKESVTSSQNFVTSLPPVTGRFSIGANHLGVSSLVSTRPDDTYQVGELEETQMPSKVPQLETFQRDINETPLNQKSPSKTGGQDPSGNTRSNYNSASIYASKAKNGPGNVDQSTIIRGVNDEYVNHETSRYSDVANIESGIPTRTSPTRGQQRDHRYNEGSNKWRGNNDNDHARYVAKYSFGYLVNDDDSHNDFGHQEMRDEGITKGRYHVRLPDGRVQKVNYQVDDSGYHAVVSYRHDSQ